jgi:4-aminobutyrate aminotransferase-like enzyme
VQAAIGDLKSRQYQVAALLLDSIFASDGVCTHPPGFPRAAVQAIRAEGALFIADEVQAGLARAGDAMRGFERHEVVPDLVTLGKPMRNGHPIAGLVAKLEIASDFGCKTRYFNTFGGNPVSAAVGIAVLEVIEKQGLLENARNVGVYLQNGL